MVRCIRVPKSKAQSVRMKLAAEGLLERDYRIQSDGDDILIPISSDGIDGYVAEDVDIERIERKETDYRNLVDVSEDLKEELPSSFDVIGDVAIVKLHEPLMPFKNQIGEAIMQVTANIRTVMLDAGVKGELRIRELEQIAGAGPSETVHKEFGVRMSVDPAKVYFNPRLATERKRIASMVANGEVIVDMFAGVAPFPLIICKHAEPEKVYAVDLNPEAKAFMERNIELNRISNIVPMNGDIRMLVNDVPRADRVIMNLPQSAFDFLPEALKISKVGGTIHLHRIQSEPDPEDIVSTAKGLGHRVNVENVTELKTYSPTSAVYVYDIKVIS